MGTDLTRELGHGELWLDEDENDITAAGEYIAEQSGSWLFDRIVPAGHQVIACFHDIAQPGEQIQIPLRREEAVKFAKAILG